MDRPQAVTSFGILNIAFGIAGFVGSAATLFDAKALSSNPAVVAMRASPEYLSWSRIQAPLGLVLAIVLFAAGIGLLRLRPWARTASIAYAVIFMVMACVTSFVYLRYALPVVLEKVSHASGVEAMVLKVAGYTASAAGVLAFIYPALLIYFMTRPHVRIALGASPWPPPLAGR